MHYLIDLDNTLLNTFFFDDKGNYDFLWSQDLKKDFGISPQALCDLFTTEFLTAMRDTRNLNSYIDIWLQKHHVDTSAEEFLEYWLSRDSNINSDVQDWIRQQKKEGHFFYIASNQPFIRMDYLWNKFPEWHSLFSNVFTSSEFKVAKPSVEFFHLCQQKIGVPFEQICLIDDNTENIQAAASLDMQTILFKTPNDLNVEDKKHRQ